MNDFRTPAWLLGPGQSQPDLRVSDAERQAMADQLSKHFADGRLDQAEFDERLSQAMNAKTYRDLDGLLTDLPPTQEAGGAGFPPGGAGATGRDYGSVPQRRGARPLLMIVVAVVALIIVGHAAVWAFGGWLWIVVVGLVVLAFARRGRRTRHPSQR